MRIYYIAGVLLSLTTILSACGEGAPVECTLNTAREARQGINKTGKFPPGTNCEAMRQLAAEGKPLPTIAGTGTAPVAAQPTTEPVAPTFDTPFVAGQQTQDLIPTTDKEARIQELEQQINSAAGAGKIRDPFTSTVINPVPKLETLLVKPPAPPKLKPAIVVRTTKRTLIAPPPPPDTAAAKGTEVTGTMEVSGTIYAIIKAAGESTSRYVKAGQLISNGKVLVKRIDTNAEPPIVVLQQNGVEVLRPVGAPIVQESPQNNAQNTASNTPAAANNSQLTTPTIAIPPLIPSN
ncbi:MAG: hypothetical protein NW214_17315 [Pseudanabaenaceae cyanobacterium bins.39]|nr:hypothetical protein [Pseudanabaenaceae cyanobacterium bins.39]